MNHFDRALKFIQAGRLDEARIYLEELLKKDPENTALLYNLGMLYIMDKDTERFVKSRMEK